MQDDYQYESSQPYGTPFGSIAIALLLHAFVLVTVVAMFLNVLGLGSLYADWEMELPTNVLIVLQWARMFQFGWYLLILPVLVDTALVIWLASKPSRHRMLTWLNYLWLGSGLMMVTVAYGVMVSPLFRMMVKLE